MRDTAQDGSSTQLCQIGLVDWDRSDLQGHRCLLVEGAVRAMVVVVMDVLGQNLIEMNASKDEQPISALSVNGALKCSYPLCRRGYRNRFHTLEAPCVTAR
jgi:hypothetical protein